MFCFDFLSSILVSVSFLLYIGKKDKKWFKRDIIVFISFLILFVLISFLVNIGKEMSLPRFRRNRQCRFLCCFFLFNISVMQLYYSSFISLKPIYEDQRKETGVRKEVKVLTAAIW